MANYKHVAKKKGQPQKAYPKLLVKYCACLWFWCVSKIKLGLCLINIITLRHGEIKYIAPHIINLNMSTMFKVWDCYTKDELWSKCMGHCGAHPPCILLYSILTSTLQRNEWPNPCSDHFNPQNAFDRKFCTFQTQSERSSEDVRN